MAAQDDLLEKLDFSHGKKYQHEVVVHFGKAVLSGIHPGYLQGRRKVGSSSNSPVILLGLISCNPTRTPTL
jgi:hypothetical protein